jgi:hypothetical protein
LWAFSFFFFFVVSGSRSYREKSKVKSKNEGGWVSVVSKQSIKAIEGRKQKGREDKSEGVWIYASSEKKE